jgi:DNA-binding CsgD family transcriptional regulator
MPSLLVGVQPTGTRAIRRTPRSANGAEVPARSDHDKAPSFDDLEARASRCRTTKQFRQLLEELRMFIPYRALLCGWGYPQEATIGFIFNHGFPVDFIHWYLSKGMLRKGPMFHEWLRTRKAQVWLDVAKRLKHRFDPELLARVRRANLQHALAGGVVSRHLWVHFSMNMGSDESCRAHLRRFEMIVPALSGALRRACPRPLLSARETAILDRRAMGQRIKRIATAEGISARTVTMHLQRIKKKLYTDDLVNAVVIAARSGMIDQTWEEWRWRNETPQHHARETSR